MKNLIISTKIMNNTINVFIGNLLFLLGIFSLHVNAQEINFDPKNYEIESQLNNNKFYSSNSASYRLKDGALTQNVGLNLHFDGIDLKEKALNYIKANWKRFKHTECIEQCLQQYESASKSIVFRQIYKGLNVDNNQIVINFDNKENVSSVYQNTEPINNDIDIIPKVNESILISLIKNIYKLGSINILSKPKLFIHFIDNQPNSCI